MAGHELASDDVVATRADVDPGAREPLVVLDALVAFLDEHGLGTGEVELAPLGDGHSNVTFALTRGDRELVLRRPPRGPLPPSAHDVLREARVVGALAGRARVPAVLAVCEDPEPIGAPFYVMERVDGVVVNDAVPAALDDPTGRRALGLELVDVLAEVHGVDWRAAGLEGFGKPTGYLERQLRRFGGLWEHNRTREIPEVTEVLAWLADHLPPEQPATVVHGDYRLGNVLVGEAAPARVTAVLDWEMATLGDPLADIGYLCMGWTEAGDEPGPIELSPVTRHEGFPTRAELVARYEEASGRAMGAADWYEALALFKTAVFMEGNYRRAVEGSSDDAYNAAFGDSVVALARRARDVTRRA